MSLVTKQTRLFVHRLYPGVRFFGAKPPKEDPLTLMERPKPLYIKEIHEPKYLELLKPQIPFYELVNIQVRGYDYVVLEQYVRFVQKTAKNLGITLNKFWGVPAQHIKQDAYQPASELVVGSETVRIHERTVQVKHLTSKVCSIFVEVLRSTKPPLVTLKISEHTPEDEEVRYIPDLMLMGMEKELEELKNTPVSVLSTTTQQKKKQK